MNRILIKKIVILIAILLIMRVLLILSLNYINVQSSNYINAENKRIALKKQLDDVLYTVTKIPGDNDGNKVVYIESDRNKEFELLINNLTFKHEVYINNTLVSQNTNRNGFYYDSDYAYKYFRINRSDYVGNTVKIHIKGKGADKVNVFLAEKYIAKDSREIRTIMHVVLLTFLVICTLVSSALYYYNKKECFFLVFALMGIISIFKSMVLGELFVFSRLMGITAQNYNFIDSLTTIVNTVLPFAIMYYLFDFKLKVPYLIIGFTGFFLLGFLILTNGSNPGLYNLMFLITFIIGNIIIIIAFLKNKPYSVVIMINNVVYSSFVIYYILAFRGILPNGGMLFFINPSYLGAVVYMAGFLIAILLKHLDKVKLLENKKQEFERILLLRGISHDLKLPLSVIKLNNQMIKKYDLSNNDIKEYAKFSLEAVLELEKMTENINSYLSLKMINNKGKYTSVKECFERLKKYYTINNHYSNCIITVECDDKDCKLKIDSLHFGRMLYNLIDNAVKYNKGEVQVTASYKIDKELFISIEDNGLGMGKEEVEMVFKPFYRIEKSRSDGGMGLGLSIVSKVVESLKGNIKIESEKGVGTKILISIPI